MYYKNVYMYTYRHANSDFTSLGWCHFDFFNLEWLVFLPCNGSLALDNVLGHCLVVVIQ